ncbi:uncharacterized protein LOC142639799 [Castanea sativa]|uniref:uncharacterized protein LOC142639799 n=1 Tax=Castanea sativa TaxID=21020 RepID=UPI003F64EDEE
MASCSSSDSVVKAIDEYHDSSSYSTSSDDSSSNGHTTEEYTSGVPGVPVETFQESIRTRTASGADTSTSIPSSSPLDEEETVYSCAIEVGRDTFPPYTRELGNLRQEAVRRPSLSKFHRDGVHRARLHPERDFHSLVTLQRLHRWGLGLDPSVEALAHELTVRRRMATMKENKGKEVVDEVARPEARPAARDKRKSLSKNLDLGSLPSRQGKKAKHGSSRPEAARTEPPSSLPSVTIVDVDSSTLVGVAPSKSYASASSQPSQRVSTNLLENEDLAWDRFQEAVTGEDVAACYDMSLKEFEHSGVHDLFKAMSKLIAASRQVTEMDKTRILLEKRIEEIKNDYRTWAEVANKAKDEAKGLSVLVDELKSNTVLTFFKRRMTS